MSPASAFKDTYRFLHTHLSGAQAGRNDGRGVAGRNDGWEMGRQESRSPSPGDVIPDVGPRGERSGICMDIIKIPALAYNIPSGPAGMTFHGKGTEDQ